MNKKLIISLAVIILLVGALTSFSSLRARDYFSNLFNNLFKRAPSLFSSATSSLESEETSKVVLYKPALDYEQAVIAAVEKNSPAVVSIIISKDLPVIEQCPSNPFGNLPPEFQQFFGDQFNFEFYQPCEKGTKRQEIGGGTGFIVSKDGLIVTNNHVVADTKASYTVLTNDGKKIEAKVLARHPSLDLAVIKITPPNGELPVAVLGDSETIKLGQTSIAIGNALGEFRNTVSVGVISGLARNVTAQGGGKIETIEGVIQTDAAINQGNSGGPLLNLKGEVIGINTAMVAGAQNIGFAIPINHLKKAIESVKKTGEIVIPFLGIRYIKISPELAKKENLPVDYGVLVRGSEEGRPLYPILQRRKSAFKPKILFLNLIKKRLTRNIHCPISFKIIMSAMSFL